jgi:hypothetical protein
MSRTRKHKYGRKLHHKKRTVSRNKIKRKMKIKSRKIKQKFKKSHMRYAKKSMKHRIQRGGNIEENYNKLITAYTQTGPSQTDDNLYEVTAQALDALKLSHSEHGLKCFRELIQNRRLFSLRNEMYLSLEEVLTIPKLDLTSDTVFLLEEKTKGHDVTMKDALEHWLEFIERAHKILHPKIPHIDQGDIQLLNLKIDILGGKIREASKKKETKLVKLYTDLVTEIAAFIAQHSKHAPPERKKDFDFFARAAPRKVRSAIPPIPKINLDLADLARIEVNKQYLTKKNKKDVLNVERIPNHILEKYLEYRLSDDRTGSRRDTQDTINRFNQKIMSIAKILSGLVSGKIDIPGYNNPDTSEGKKLFLLLQNYDLIPVYTDDKDLLRSDEKGQYDYVEDTECKKSVSGKDFDKTFFSSIISGKSHCRTCGRCMNTEDTSKSKEWVYKVCIQCNDLFNPSKQPPPLSSREPGGAAAPSLPFRLSSPRSPSRSSSPGAAPVTSSLRSPRRSLSPRLSSQGAAAVSPSPQRLSPPRSSVRSSSPDITLPRKLDPDEQSLHQRLADVLKDG